MTTAIEQTIEGKKLEQNQRKAVLTDGKNICVNAGAGSGKTFTLVKEYLSIALKTESSTDFKQILAITFTNKAAQEMKERILSHLRSLSMEVSDDPKLVEIYKESTGLSKEKIRARSAKVHERILHNYSEFNVLTIDKFVHKLIRAFSSDLGLQNDFNIELDSSATIGEAVDQIMSEAGINQELTELLIDYTLRNSDDEKSWNLNKRLSNTSNEINKENHLKHLQSLQKFKTEDFKQMIEVIERDYNKVQKEIKSIARHILKQIDAAGIDPSDFTGASHIGLFFEKMAKRADLDVLSKSMATHFKSAEADQWRAKSKKVASADMIDSLAPEISAAFLSIIDYRPQYSKLHLLRANCHNLALLTKVMATIQKIRDERNMILVSDFNRMISSIVMNESAPYIYERVGEKHKHYFIDEFQDTSVMQWQNFLPLIDNSLSTGHKNLVVGDPKQAIYRWRDGEVRQMVELPKIFDKPEKSNLDDIERTLERNKNEQVLNINWRSQKTVVDFNNEFFEAFKLHLTEEHAKAYDHHRQAPREGANGGYVRYKFFSQEELKGEKSADELYEEEVLSIVQSLEGRYHYGEIAILIRKKKSGDHLADKLIANNIPVVSPDSLLLMKNPEIRKVVNLLRLILDPSDTIAKLDLLKDFGGKDLPKLAEGVALRVPQAMDDSFHLILTQNQISLDSKKLQGLPIYELLTQLIGMVSKETETYFETLLDQALKYVKKNGEDLVGFMNMLDEKQEKLTVLLPESQGAVKLMTIHKSKGLQYPVVIVPHTDWPITGVGDHIDWLQLDKNEYGIDRTIYAHNEKKMELAGLQREYAHEYGSEVVDSANLLYVALTRAEEELYVVSKHMGKSSVSPLINQVVSAMPGYDEELGELRLGEQPARTPKTLQDNESGISAPPFATWRERISISTTDSRMLFDDDSLLSPRKHGEIVHEILARLPHYGLVGETIAKMQEDGLIKDDMVGALEAEIEHIFTHPRVRSWFGKEVTAKAECDIIDRDGLAHRPDRLIFDEDCVTVLDFKTGHPNQESETKYQQQIREYGQLMEELGYPEVKMYLVYSETLDIQEVTAHV
ncbi:MAG: hypothetical protein COB65_13605 [Thalassobium sp.]|nr:MAG: hypothetical protein COB65_13605 [Thalassobium sp.]